MQAPPKMQWKYVHPVASEFRMGKYSFRISVNNESFSPIDSTLFWAIVVPLDSQFCAISNWNAVDGANAVLNRIWTWKSIEHSSTSPITIVSVLNTKLPLNAHRKR